MSTGTSETITATLSRWATGVRFEDLSDEALRCAADELRPRRYASQADQEA